MKVETKPKIESTLKVQLIGSTIVLLGITYLVCIFAFPQKFYLDQGGQHVPTDLHEPWEPYVCSILGLISGMIIAAFT